jgi:simple sugar transport system ATP-binding protein
MSDMSAKAPAPVPLLELQEVSKTYGHVRALVDVNFAILSHEVIGLIGDNGAGKSTLVKIISGIERPDAGRFLSQGRLVSINSRRDSEALGVETIYQDIALVGPMSITRNVFAGREITNALGFLRLSDMRKTTMDILNYTVDIAGINSPDLRVELLSGGQQQAVAIARAVHFKNKMLLLDEPTSALSVRETEKVLQYIAQLRSEGVSCVFVTHNLYHAFQVCDRFVVMAQGRVVLDVAKSQTGIEELTRVVVSH